ncbi:MAG: FKBP-type peptidyl-prolyl cis-trans isomerase [Candidatus Heimdallarchaeota archaeon]|nr:MAG: FKBP-type peptidyl-prolyl cis-trans isomerase [Candidatus Heimdallarchaeota archaeon]
MWKTRLILLSIFFSLWAFNLGFVIAVEPADYGDVVDVNYSLWLDEGHTIEKEGNINVNLRYIYLRRSQTEPVPTKVYRALPAAPNEDLQQVYLQAFIDAVIGMEVDETKNFMIAAKDAYGNEDLYYYIKILALLYDASAQDTEEKETSDPFKDFYPLLIGGSVIVAGGGLAVWYVYSSRTHKSALSEEKMSSAVRAKSIQRDKDKIKELRELTEAMIGSAETAKKEEVKFRRRR